MSWFDYVESFGVIGALGVGAFLSRRLVLERKLRDEDRRTERALELYRDLGLKETLRTPFIDSRTCSGPQDRTTTEG